MKLVVYVLIFHAFTLGAVDRIWVFKRELGGIRIYKPLAKSLSEKQIRATYQKFEGKSVLAALNNRERLIKNFEKDKAKALTFFGITKWQAKDYHWVKGKELTVTGTYINREGKSVSFKEFHKFNENSRHVIVLTREDGGIVDSDLLTSFKEEVLREGAP